MHTKTSKFTILISHSLILFLDHKLPFSQLKFFHTLSVPVSKKTGQFLLFCTHYGRVNRCFVNAKKIGTGRLIFYISTITTKTLFFSYGVVQKDLPNILTDLLSLEQNIDRCRGLGVVYRSVHLLNHIMVRYLITLTIDRFQTSFGSQHQLLRQ